MHVYEDSILNLIQMYELQQLILLRDFLYSSFYNNVILLRMLHLAVLLKAHAFYRFMFYIACSIFPQFNAFSITLIIC